MPISVLHKVANGGGDIVSLLECSFAFRVDSTKEELITYCWINRGVCASYPPMEKPFAMTKAIFSPEVKKAIDSILLRNPSVVSGKMFGYPAYYINRKLFACIYEKGVGVKIPADLANQLIVKKDIVYFQPMGRARMKEWVQINRENPEDYLKDEELFATSMSFVASLGSK